MAAKEKLKIHKLAMLKISFLIALCLIALIDYKTHKIPNLLIVPLIIVALLITKNILWCVLAFMIASIFYFDEENIHEFSVWRGGDVKLAALIGTIIGWKVLIVMFLVIISVAIYYFLTEKEGATALAPFFLASSLIFIF